MWKAAEQGHPALSAQHNFDLARGQVFYFHVSIGNVVTLLVSTGGAGSLDSECRPDPGEQRPELAAAEDSFWTDSLLLHPANLSLHL